MRLLVAALVVAIAGCATSVMKGYVGQDIKQVVVERGAPQNAMDMGDGRRAFQWAINQSVFVPATTSQISTVNVYGNTAIGNSTATTYGGGTSSWTCLYTLYATWDEARATWIVKDYQKPTISCL
jgi:hypothetical protein